MLLRIKEIKEQYKIDRNSLLSWEAKGILKSCKTPGGHRRYLQRDIEDLLGLKCNKNNLKVAFYARVSTKKQAKNLDRQIQRLKSYCESKGYDNVKEFYEIASGLNGRRRQLHKLIEQVTRKKINHIIVEYKDRLARFGLEYILHFLEGCECSIEFLEEKPSKDDSEEMAQDILSVIVSFSGRLYGRRGGRKKLREKLQL